jgi:hypothetical protein
MFVPIAPSKTTTRRRTVSRYRLSIGRQRSKPSHVFQPASVGDARRTRRSASQGGKLQTPGSKLQGNSKPEAPIPGTLGQNHVLAGNDLANPPPQSSMGTPPAREGPSPLKAGTPHSKAGL